MLQHRQFTKCQEVDPVIVCRLCEDSWDEPIELQPCGHFFCEACISEYESRFPKRFSPIGGSGSGSGRGASTLLCPTCNCKVERRDRPNRILVNMALEVEVKCRRCEWRGKREETQKHTCPVPPLPSTEVKSTPNSTKSAAHISMINTNLDDALRNFGEVDASAQNSTLMAPAEDLPLTERPARPLVQPLAHNLAQLSMRSPERRSQPLVQPPVRPAVWPPPRSSSNERLWEQYGLKQVEYDQIMGVFMHFDTEGSGFLTRSQLRDLAFSLNYVNREEDIDRILSELGCEEGGGVMFHDLCIWLGSHHPDPQALYGLSRFQYTEVLLQFRSFDTENRGALNWDAFRQLCLKNGYAANEGEALKLFRSCTTGDETHVSLRQFLSLCQRLWGVNDNAGNQTQSPNIFQQQQQQQPWQTPSPLPGPTWPADGQGGNDSVAEPFPLTQFPTHGKKKKACSVM
ncbi:EF hand [Trypanosoma grayi]|uniref:EF hand n=1 Tax=Trypanosoma grayi TaxID=71804 RepID=UPI0004F4A1B5|nr:EF hand [Trypanosoma grayi]KEG08180.1 EF hand [Trypanosoma grayi]